MSTKEYEILDRIFGDQSTWGRELVPEVMAGNLESPNRYRFCNPYPIFIIQGIAITPTASREPKFAKLFIDGKGYGRVLFIGPATVDIKPNSLLLQRSIICEIRFDRDFAGACYLIGAAGRRVKS